MCAGVGRADREEQLPSVFVGLNRLGRGNDGGGSGGGGDLGLSGDAAGGAAVLAADSLGGEPCDLLDVRDSAVGRSLVKDRGPTLARVK